MNLTDEEKAGQIRATVNRMLGRYATPQMAIDAASDYAAGWDFKGPKAKFWMDVIAEIKAVTRRVGG